MLADDARSQLIHLLATVSHDVYCNALLYSMPGLYFVRLQNILNTAARIHY